TRTHRRRACGRGAEGRTRLGFSQGGAQVADAHHRPVMPVRTLALRHGRNHSLHRRRKSMATTGGNGRVALVTGGMGGLGETIATKMVDGGYRVVVTYSP